MNSFKRGFSVFNLFFILSAALLGAEVQAASYVGVGVTIQAKDKDFVIVDVKEGAPADRMGIRPGVFLRRVDGADLFGLNLDQVIDRVRGPAGVPVVFTIQDPGQTLTRDVELIREVIEVECFIEGNISLRLSGSAQSGSISGWVDRHYVDWRVGFSSVSGNLNGEWIRLDLDDRIGSQRLSGYIHGTWVVWSGFNGNINAYQACIPK